MTLDRKNKILMIEMIEKINKIQNFDEMYKFFKNEKEPDILKILNENEIEILIASLDKNGFQPDGIHYQTKTKYNKEWFDKNGRNKKTGTK
ncbi:MAG: hypothetical protein KA384_08660 [Leptotrichiaceae bacterium]|nr:hypothetical protein [Leptotrichiaceae bacterium]